MAIINRRLSNVERGHGGGRVRLVSCQIKPEAHFVKRRHVAGFRPTIFITLDFAKVTKEASRERFRQSLVSGAPASEADLEMLFQAMAGRLERSDVSDVASEGEDADRATAVALVASRLFGTTIGTDAVIDESPLTGDGPPNRVVVIKYPS
jgi:hypothetical protein